MSNSFFVKKSFVHFSACRRCIFQFYYVSKLRIIDGIDISSLFFFFQYHRAFLVSKKQLIIKHSFIYPRLFNTFDLKVSDAILNNFNEWYRNWMLWAYSKKNTMYTFKGRNYLCFFKLLVKISNIEFDA